MKMIVSAGVSLAITLCALALPVDSFAQDETPVDPQQALREKAEATPEVHALRKEYDDCVAKAGKTAETACTEEHSSYSMELDRQIMKMSISRQITR